ncbi:hypothetical protein [Diplocloster agilis]|uniref:Uncharacterized protein n=1 Tax=Diplocloster agilis TaxID=2850323 RepID=A0A949NFF1_9FIRM|nr:hypothetical protein [Diplocloster agilis]MBU9737599.1 hypothetical protein [Diplocloster agilis]
MDKFILNIIHRPEMVPEYAEKVTGHGKEEDLGRETLLTESLDIFRTQQEIAHRNGFKTTIQMTYASLFNEEAVSLAKEHHDKYGDEISLTLLGLPCEEFREKYKTKDFCIWMFSLEDKKTIVRDVFEKFHDCFGFYPESTGSYYMDAELTNYIKAEYPTVKCAVATCWEEGPKAYHTCNNSWYTLFDGGPWNPWIPSKQNTHAPAENEEQDSGIVAIPHLSRDLIACFDGNGSNFGTHPQNVLRGMIYKDGQYPYLYNLIDQYRSLKKYNRGYAYNMMFVGPGWMNKMGRWEAPYELLLKSYEDGMAYYAKLRDEGGLEAMTMAEFADFYRANKTYSQPECALWRDILYGSEKQLFWYADPYMRTCVDMNQGGALVDLRPYAAKIDWPVGIGTRHVQDASYPFLIQEKYRAGYFTHYAGEGTIKSCKIVYKGEEVDMCLCRTKAHFSEDDDTRILTLEPVEIEFYDLTVKMQTTFYFVEGSSEIRIKREILKMSNPGAEVEIQEYFTGCYGTTEYPEDMSDIILSVTGPEEEQSIRYAYKCREAEAEHAQKAEVLIPDINTKASVGAKEDVTGYIREGYAFSPMYTLGLKKRMKEGEVLNSWLKVEKAD